LLDQGVASVAEHPPKLLTQRAAVPGADVVIISPEQLIAADPDCVLLTLPDLYEEVRQC
jgi:ABC-type Fe3+-hydroxamate transport system substrate-binding protein